jgi:hypothetical protein
MAPLALFGIDNDGIGIAANLLVIFLIAMWIALVFWAYNDARRRLDDPVLIFAAAFAALVFPFAGALIYAIVRPPETIDDRYERELDIRAGELRVRILEQAAKGGSSSKAFAAAVSDELAGEPSGRPSSRGESKPKQPPARKAASPQRSERPPARESDRTPAAERQAARAAERPPSKTSERPAAERPATARPSKAARAEEPRRRPTTS